MVDPRLSWTEWLINLQLSEPKDMVIQCIDMLQKAFPKVSDRELMSTVEKAVLADMGQLQLQPDIMDNHRRFVVLVTETRNEQSAESEGVSIHFVCARVFEHCLTCLIFAGRIGYPLEVRLPRRLLRSSVVRHPC